jgi:hypothetical protein
MRQSRSEIREGWRSVPSPGQAVGPSGDNSRFQHGIY